MPASSTTNISKNDYDFLTPDMPRLQVLVMIYYMRAFRGGSPRYALDGFWHAGAEAQIASRI